MNNRKSRAKIARTNYRIQMINPPFSKDIFFSIAHFAITKGGRALLYRDTFTPVYSVKVSEPNITYRSIMHLFLQIITVPLY